MRILPAVVDLPMFRKMRCAKISPDIEIFTGTICSIHEVCSRIELIDCVRCIGIENFV